MRAILITGLLTTAVTAGAWGFHNHLVKSTPAADEVVKVAPKQVRLWFAERPDVALSNISLLTSDSAKVEIAKVQSTDDTLSVVAAIPSALPAGKYIVSWRSASRDGHAVRGKYAFTLQP